MRFFLLIVLIALQSACGPHDNRESPLEREEEVTPGDFRDTNQADPL